MFVKNELERMAQGVSPADPQSNLSTYLTHVENPEEELAALQNLFKQFLMRADDSVLSSLERGDLSEMDRLSLLVRLGMDIPFDYIGNNLKTAQMMADSPSGILGLGESIPASGFHFLRTPREALEDHLNFGTGGDCFTTSFLMQLLLSSHGIESRLALAHKAPEGVESPEKRYHCVTLARADGTLHYIDTSLNVEVPVPINTGLSDSRSDSTVMRLLLQPLDGFVGVGYLKKATMPALKDGLRGIKGASRLLLQNLMKKASHLWYFSPEGQALDEVMASMRYTLHPDVPPSGTNRFNRNQQVRLAALRSNETGPFRHRIFYNESKRQYVAVVQQGQKVIGNHDLGIGHDHETGIISGDRRQLAEYVSREFGVSADQLLRSMDALDYINQRSGPNR